MSSAGRPLVDETDRARIMALVRARAGETLHVADLPYRLASPSAHTDEDARVWEDGRGDLVAFAVVQLAWGTLDYFIRPDARGGEIEDGLMTWALGRFSGSRTCAAAIWIGGLRHGRTSPTGWPCWNAPALRLRSGMSSNWSGRWT